MRTSPSLAYQRAAHIADRLGHSANTFAGESQAGEGDASGETKPRLKLPSLDGENHLRSR